MGIDDRTSNTEEMETNQQAYGEGSEKIAISSDGNTYSGAELTPNKILEAELTLDKSGMTDLQTHRTGSGLDITSYSLYSGFKEPGKDPEKVIVGVAGTSDLKDWGQNLNSDINRSRYNNDSDEKLQNDLNDNFWHWHDKAEIKYELEIRQKVRALQTYRDNGIPISMVGDSKGGEDAAYLALSFVKATTAGALPGRGKDYDYSALSLYLTNPKGIRVSKEDREVLQKMADAGKITIEVVYPEILGNVGGHRIPDEIPYSRKIFTVPNALNGSFPNHMISGYESKVYQGFGGNYKFQCDEEPTVLSEMQWVEEDGLTIGFPKRKVWKSVDVGYRYVVSRITDRSGKTMSVNDYFFEEQIRKVERLRSEMIERIHEYNKIIDEPLLDYFTQEVGKQKYRLEEKHKQWISRSTSFEMYYEENKGLVDSGEKTRSLLERDYEDELSKHVESESDHYKTVVKSRVEGHIDAYKERVHNQISRLMHTVHRVDTEMLPSLRESHQTFMKSQEQVKFIVEKRH